MIIRSNGATGGSVIAAQSKINSYINVTFPSGSTCTCSNGDKTFVAPTPSGTASFSIPITGNWTVFSTDNSGNVASRVVRVQNNSVYNIILSYDLLLYTPGDEHTDITGGWVSDTANAYSSASAVAPTVERADDHLHITGSPNGSFHTRLPVKFTNRTYIEMNYNMVAAMDNSSYFRLIIYNTTTGVSADTNQIKTFYPPLTKGQHTLRCYIADLEGNYYPSLFLYGAGKNIDIYSIIIKADDREDPGVLISDGVVYDGWVCSNTSINMDTGSVNFTTTGNNYGFSYITKDVTNYDTLTIEINDISKSYTATNLPAIGISTGTPTHNNGTVTPNNGFTKFTVGASGSGYPVTAGTYTLNISSLTGTKTIWLTVGGASAISGNKGYLKITNMYLS